MRTCSVYSPFGVECDGRTVSGGYRYGFNGEESVDEVSGQKHSYDYGNRFYDPRIGKFMTSTFTTPNELFKDSKSYVNSGILDGKVLKDNNNFKQPFITNSQSGGWGTSTPSDPIQTSVGQMGVQ
jgi:hypothetical protein